MKNLKALKLHTLFTFSLMALCFLLSNEVSAQSACSNWKAVASEGEQLNLSGTQVVRYGTDSKYVEKTVPSGTRCHNDTFGDPAPGKHKLCSVCQGTTPAASCWTVVAAEHQRLSVTGTQVVRYGTDKDFIEKTVPNNSKCNSAVFGSDPAPGKRKKCSVCQ